MPDAAGPRHCMGAGMRNALLFALVAASLLASACGNFGKAPEDRINDAFPVADSAGKARTALSEFLGDPGTAKMEEIDAEMASRLKIRALTCGKGHEPGLFESDEETRAAIANAECFTECDKALTNWLNHRRIEMLLSAAPLLPIPEDIPRFITAKGNIGTAWFADKAGVALLVSSGTLEILDVKDSRAIFSESRSKNEPWQTSARISPNGRLFLSSRQGSLSIRATETGETLADYDDVGALFWLDGRTALLVSRNGAHEPQLIDFAAGEQLPVRGVSEGITKVVPAPETGQFVISTYRSLVRIALDRSTGTVHARVVDEEPLGDMRMWSDGNGSYTRDHKSYVSGGGPVGIATLDPLSVRTVALDSLQVQSAWPTPDPDRILATGVFRTTSGAEAMTFVISMRDLMIAPLDTPSESARYFYIPAFDRVGAITQSRIEVLDELPLGEFRSFEEFAESLRVELQLRQLDAAQRGSGQAIAIPDGLPVPDWARNGEVAAVGVYESTRGSHGIGKPSRAGPVKVQVRRGRKPVILVLTSYEPVQWQIEKDLGAQIAAVLVGGYHTSEVRGTDGVRQLDIGNVYAYEQGSEEYRKLEAAVARRTGLRIASFQGRYSGETFAVGGQ